MINDCFMEDCLLVIISMDNCSIRYCLLTNVVTDVCSVGNRLSLDQYLSQMTLGISCLLAIVSLNFTNCLSFFDQFYCRFLMIIFRHDCFRWLRFHDSFIYLTFFLSKMAYSDRLCGRLFALMSFCWSFSLTIVFSMFTFWHSW